MKLRLLLLIFVYVLLTCSSNDDIDFPNCLQESIDTALNHEPTTPRASIKKYLFNKEEVYLIEIQNGFADGMSTVVNETCELICSIGGIAGLICEGFNEAEFIEIVWEDPR